MKHLLTTLLLILFGASLQAQQLYHRAKVSLKGHDIKELALLGIETDHGQLAPGRYLINDFSEAEIQRIKEAGFACEILIENVSAYYAHPDRQPENTAFAKSQNCDQEDSGWGFETPAHYQQGSMGGYFTFAEMEAILDQMVAEYPHLITPKQIAGTSHEGRPIYWLRVSDNPNTDEEEPEILYTALHHAREPNSLSQMIFYLWYLLENYDTSEEVKYLVDQTEMYFMPCVNPDGYVYNETTNPNGGGLWRKNRWVNPDDGQTYGVDLNRNYGYQWGYDNFGSSDNPESNIFRGTAAFSEPETQAVRDLANAHQFQIALNYHTFGNLLIHPWGYNDQPTTEDDLFKGFGHAMTQDNNFLVGTGVETVGYIVNGDSDDWMYGEQTEKPRIFSMTPEVGPSFWPAPSQIDDLNKSVMRQNLTAAHLLLNYTEVEELSPSDYLSASGQLQLSAKKYGLQSGSTEIWVEAIEPYLSVNASPQTFTLNPLEAVSLNIPFTISGDAENQDPLTFVVHINNGLWEKTDTLSKIYLNGQEEVLLSDDADDLSLWTSDSWSTTTEDYYSPYTSITDSPNATYGNNADKLLLLETPISIPEDALFAQLSFRAKWAIESNWDYVQVLAISGGGATSTPLCGRYTTNGTGSFQPNGEPLYDGTQNDWVAESIDLSDYIGQDIQIAFRLRSDEYQQLDGFYFDDLEITALLPQSVATLETFPLSGISLFPNPATDHLQLSFQSAEAGLLEIGMYTTGGQKVLGLSANAHTGSNSIRLPTASLPAGLYFLQIRSQSGTQTMRFVRL